ncbi:MAG: hypothetical protein CM15mP84_08900 [Cellvibrionales bacterium]|nr:MAG: hypothetical protein CM15mP84_08900 [Cellvibrionales bacterium]
MLEAYRQHVAERAAQQIPPAPLSPEQVSGLVDLLKIPRGEEDFLVELLTRAGSSRVDEAAYVRLVSSQR